MKNNIEFSSNTKNLPEPEEQKLLTDEKESLLTYNKAKELPFNSVDTVGEIREYLGKISNIQWTNSDVGFLQGKLDDERFTFNEKTKLVKVFKKSGQPNGQYSFDNFFDLVRNGNYDGFDEKVEKVEMTYSQLTKKFSEELEIALESGKAREVIGGVEIGGSIIPAMFLENLDMQKEVEKEEVVEDFEFELKKMKGDIFSSNKINPSIKERQINRQKMGLLTRYLKALEKANKTA